MIVAEPQPSPLVPGNKPPAGLTELQPLDPGVMAHQSHRSPTGQIHQAHRPRVQQVGQSLALWGTLGPTLVHPYADQSRIDRLGTYTAQDLVAAVLDDRQLTRAEDQADARVVEKELLGS